MGLQAQNVEIAKNILVVKLEGISSNWKTPYKNINSNLFIIHSLKILSPKNIFVLILAYKEIK